MSSKIHVEDDYAEDKRSGNCIWNYDGKNGRIMMMMDSRVVTPGYMIQDEQY